MDLKEITELIKAVDNSKLNEFKLRTEDFSLKMSKFGSIPYHHTAPLTISATHEVPKAPYENLREPMTIIPQEPEKELTGNIVESPIVGTFYRSPAPDKPPFVQQGDSVKKGDILCLIEAMKVINEITSGYDGTITEILTENGKLVEYGQPLFRIE